MIQMQCVIRAMRVGTIKAVECSSKSPLQEGTLAGSDGISPRLSVRRIWT